VRVYWPGPLPHRLPHFWLPVEAPEAVGYLLAARRPGSVGGAALRRLWRLVHKAGLLAPLYVVGRRSAAEDGATKQVGDPPLPSSAPLLLLTTGHRSVNKVVGLAFEGEGKPTAAVKFARVAEAEPGLEREAAVLQRLGEERPGSAAVPGLRGVGHRAGRLTVVEDAVEGESLLGILDRDNFEEMAMRVTRVLIDLAAGDGQISAPAVRASIGARLPARDQGWRQRLVEEPLARFEAEFGAAVEPSAIDRARALLDDLGDVPSACEHRDCSPWNILVTSSGDPVLLDWESAEPDGLPGLDLVYFLANCAFVLDGALESGRTRESYARLLDPQSEHGRIAARAVAEYTSALGIRPEDFRRLRLLCWVVHSRSDYRHLQLETGGASRPEDLRRGMFLGLVEEELR
jgi:Phosphotransferase enzyme family